MQGDGAARRTSRRALWRRRPLRSLLVSNGASLAGSEAYDFTLLMLTTAAYGSMLSIAWLGVALRLAPIVISPIAGVLFDREPRRRANYARLADLIRAGLLGVLGLLLIRGELGGPLPYVLIAFAAGLDAVFMAGVRSSLPRLFRSDDESRALLASTNSLIVTQWTFVQIVMPPLTVVLLRFFAPSTIILLNAATFLVSYGLLRTYAGAVNRTYDEARNESASEPERQEAGGLRAFWDQFSAGMRVAFASPIPRTILLLAAVGQGMLFAAMLAIPSVVDDRGWSNWLVGASFATIAVGGLIGSIVASDISTPRDQLRWLIVDSIMRVVAIGMFAVSSRPILLIGALILGLAAGLSSVVRVSYIQGYFTDDVLARVFVTMSIVGQSLMPVMPIAYAALRDATDSQTAFLVGALAMAIASTAWLSCRGEEVDPTPDKTVDANATST